MRREVDFSFGFLFGTKTRIRLLLSRAYDRESERIENQFCVGRLTEVKRYMFIRNVRYLQLLNDYDAFFDRISYDKKWQSSAWADSNRPREFQQLVVNRV